MPVILVKGQKISLQKEAGRTLDRIVMGLGWDPETSPKSGGLFGKLFGSGNKEIDLDASCLMFDEQGNIVDAIWFQQLKSRDGSVQHTGDNVSGQGEGDDEQIKVSLSRVPPQVSSLMFVVNSFSGQTFAAVKNAFVRLVDESTGTEVARYDLSCKGEHTALIMCKIYRQQGEWKMHAIGDNAKGRTFHDLLPQLRGVL